MKRIAFILFSVMLVASAVAQDRLTAVAPRDPRTMAMGGAFVAMSSGYQSLFGNPASFADAEAELTLLSLNPWVYVSPTTGNIETLSAALDDPSTGLVENLSDLITTNGIGAGMSGGLGWVGKGLGLGLIGSVDTYVWGRNAPGATGTLDGQNAGVIGVGFPVRLFGMDLSVGGNLRPYLRMTGPISSTQLGSLLSGGDPADAITNVPVDVGFGLAVDLGARLDLGRFLSVGLAIRDISTSQNLTSSTFGEVLDSLANGDLPPADTTESYSVLPNITLGASMRPLPEGISGIVDLLLVLEIQDPVGVIVDKLTVWQLLHAGVEAKFLGGLFALRTGLNEGYISLGAGIDLLIFEANIAVFTEEMGLRPGDRPRTGVSADFSIRL
ncbi:MAG: hypothetical protein E4H20_11670 [Spirochaetales bacterium]|nr:MAG: hypothetical protein E4H20_11670 [Spirochaetales bacterium]